MQISVAFLQGTDNFRNTIGVGCAKVVQTALDDNYAYIRAHINRLGLHLDSFLCRFYKAASTWGYGKTI